MPEHLSTETAFTEFDSSRNLLYRLRTWILAAGVSALTTFLTLTGTLHHAPAGEGRSRLLTVYQELRPHCIIAMRFFFFSAIFPKTPCVGFVLVVWK